MPLWHALTVSANILRIVIHQLFYGVEAWNPDRLQSAIYVSQSKHGKYFKLVAKSLD